MLIVDVHREYITEQDADDETPPTAVDNSRPPAIIITSDNDDTAAGPAAAAAAAAEDEIHVFRAPPTPPVSALVSHCYTALHCRFLTLPT